MPRNRVINRRNVNPLVMRSIAVSDEAMDEVRDLAAGLEVSLGSVVDTAMRTLVMLPPERVVELMRQHKHLTDDEYAYVRQLLAKQSGGAGKEEGGR